MKRFPGSVLLLSTLMLFVAACDGGGNDALVAPKIQLQFDVTGLTPLLDGYHYQGWAKVGFEFIPGESFNVTESGSFTDTAGQFIQKSFILPVDLTEASIIFITIEGKHVCRLQCFPSDTIVLAGDVTGFGATLTTSHSMAIGSTFAGETGEFSLMTLSDNDTSNETSGVWFTTGSPDNLSPGLTLVSPPDGWAYQGWVDTGTTLLTTGAFISNTGHDLGRPHSLPDVPPFPGEDFLINAPLGESFPPDLSGAEVYITMEPLPDDTSDPFGIRILEGQIPASPQSGTTYSLTSVSVGPSGTATIF